MEIIIIIIVNLIDRLSKIWAIKTLREGNDVVIIKDIFSLSYLENRGAAWGIFQGKTNFLLIVSIVIIVGMIYFIFKYRPKNMLMRVSLSFIIGGAVGNMYDRMFNKYVVDFIYFHYKDIYSFPTFNVADMSVVLGTILLAICLIKDDSNGIF
ncbi:lipoprotein signal peptidase [Clostridium pasteurianum DSM 525 = ATCC 6013]|uniref:Lipoprotein signal peptidase n=1 Tax=Clostridium pasteurianum DSM 525 = ATCC 6013 TaxID=1262449 RepID=A0A0H3J396_CLOPA|nr:signal peptidase II [Clostridium pasteurianum]AJA47939.1 lipoprotein signal peptidase [Clostridium pasteurianum DSM 525 = ATCC 6013]AJA51927.1 lipoprotein signal peptidase [Clostridium pasteurianum DSM 525 = ATCC 6013]AOZ75226.1 signal peptidase II [Clostridium pasteurianum DSM 525 = ATCC 6013]AOZ79021.1 signal peptidase II [Clostridium pasteurianum]ELP59842.1 lipoprotein signal peptidase [Clostridium pasteurianum DSM 525 = ATCC 6013]